MTAWGKRWSLRRLADERGRFRMVAADQRPPIAQLVARARGIPQESVAYEDMCAVKRLLAEELAPHASAMLVDPNFAYPAVIEVVPASRGLVVTLEEHRYEDGPSGRRSRSIPDWSVEKIKRLGGDGVKVLAWYRPDAARDVLEHQRAYVEAVGRACVAQDIPYVLELLVYPFAGAKAAGSAYEEDPARHPQLVIDSVREFADPRYAVDLFKLESPLPATALAGRDDGEVQALFDELGRAAGRPWVMLSAGAEKEDFLRVLRHAYRAGAGGFLAGRAIWRDALAAYPDIEACRAALRRDAVPYMERLRELTQREAAALPAAPASRFTREGEFAAGYPVA